MTTMDFSATLAALRRLRVETGSLVCFGCGHEHNCSTHGCAILRNAVEHMEAALSNYDSLSALVHHLETELKSEILSAAELRARMANEPLTLEQLREMDGEPVYIIAKDMGIAEWNVITGKEPIAIAYDCPMPGFKSVVEGIAFANGRAFRAGAYGITWLAYRRPPEGEANA